MLIKEKLRVQVLLVRPLVDDCHGPERIGSALCLPFGPEDIEERSLDLIWFHRGHRQADGLGATHPLGPRQHRVEQRAAGIRVDLDELRTRGAQVKVVPQETAGETGIEMRDLRSPRENRTAECRSRDDSFYCVDDARHLRDLSAGHEQRNGSKQMRMSIDHALRKPQRTQLPFELTSQGTVVQGQAAARTD